MVDAFDSIVNGVAAVAFYGAIVVLVCVATFLYGPRRQAR